MNNTLQPNTTNWVVIYRKQKQDRINYLNSHYSGLYKNNRKKQGKNKKTVFLS